MSSKKDIKETIQPVAFKQTLEEKYLAYAMSTITARSLPDVRDGLKPVHRRLLFAMLQLKLDPKQGFKKCARVVGDVIGKYHPHGDQSVYDAMVRLAQGFAVRYPLVDGQGNFGSVDGDNAAAMRYTEARLTEVAMAMLSEINQDTVDFRPTYDGEDAEPVVLPAAFPNLLANGSEGIAVGMATSIPPHNVGELCDALIHLVEKPDCTVARLVKRVPGPDFPTGGIIVEPEANILAAYETGRGAIKIRSKWEVEQLPRGLYQVVITEIPYQVQKSRLIEKTAELFKAKKLPLLADIRDESAEEIRIVMEPKSKQVDPEILMESLFKSTDFESRFNLNLNVLSGKGIPQVMNLKEILQEFLDHRIEVLVRRTNWRLEKIAHRLEVLDGMLICYLNLDEVIRIIRESDEPKQELIDTFDLTEVQVEYILNTRLRSLRKLEEMEIKREHKELKEEQKALQKLLKSDELRWEKIIEEIRDIKKRFGASTTLGKRRTEFGDAPTGKVVSIEAFVEKEPITIIVSKMGWVRALKGHDLDISDVKYKEGDAPRFAQEAHTTDKLMVFASNGRFYSLPCSSLPRTNKTAAGEPVRLMIDLDNTEDLVEISVLDTEATLLVASTAGKGFIVDAADVEASTKNGKQILNLTKDAKASVCSFVADDHDMVAVIGSNRKMLVFPIEQLPKMKKGQGVMLQKYRGGTLGDVRSFNSKEGLSWEIGNRVRNETDLRAWKGNRADVGRTPPTGFPRSNKFGDPEEQ